MKCFYFNKISTIGHKISIRLIGIIFFRKIVHAFLRLDPCTFTISGGIRTAGLEPYTFEYQLLDVEYGNLPPFLIKLNYSLLL